MCQIPLRTNYLCVYNYMPRSLLEWRLLACCYFKYKIKFDVQLDLVKKCEYVQYKALQLSVNLSINKQKKEPHKVKYMYAAHFFNHSECLYTL